jgi:hypothetical protein
MDEKSIEVEKNLNELQILALFSCGILYDELGASACSTGEKSARRQTRKSAEWTELGKRLDVKLRDW